MPLPDLSQYQPKLYPNKVIFTRDWGYCVVIVEVFLANPTPRIVVYREGGDAGYHKVPVTLRIDELVEFTRKGRKMIDAQTDVKSKSQVVGKALYPVFETASEAVDKLGEEALLVLLNSIVRTNAMNEVRAAATGKPSEKKLTDMAWAELDTEDITAAAQSGEPNAMQNLFDDKKNEIRARVEAAQPTAPADEDADETEGEE